MSDRRHCRPAELTRLLQLPAAAPAMLLIGVLSGIAVFFTPLRWGVFLFPPLLAARPVRRQPLPWLIIGLLAGWFGAWRQSDIPQGNYAQLLNGRNQAGILTVEIIDYNCSAALPPDIGRPAQCRAAVRSFQATAMPAAVRCNGVTLIRLPAEAPPVNYGDRLVLQGIFFQPSPPPRWYRFSSDNPAGTVAPLPGFRYADYLAARDVAATFLAQTVLQITAPPHPGVTGTLLTWRDALLNRTIAGTAPATRQLLAAMLFGCRQGIPPATRQEYIVSGTIHLLTVSGLHVGIVAMLALLLLRPVPYRWRYWLTLLALILYVMMTGMQIPALRALLLLGIWCVCRASLRQVPGLNIILVTAAVLLVLQPANRFDLGFQYTFIVTGFLLLGASGARRLRQLWLEKRRWLPPGVRHRFQLDYEAIGLKLWSGCGGCLTAFLAAAAISLYHQGYLVPGSIPANLVLLPLVNLLFLAVGLKLTLLQFLPAEWSAGLLDFLAGLIGRIVGFCAAEAEATSAIRPPLWSLVLYFLGLTLLVGHHCRLRRLYCGLALLLAVLLGWHLGREWQTIQLTVFRGGDSQLPGVLLCDPARNYAAAINLPSYEAARSVGTLLDRQGIRRLELLAFSDNRIGNLDGLPELLRRSRLQQLARLNTDKSRSKPLEELLRNCVLPLQTARSAGETATVLSIANGEIIRENRRLALAYHPFGENIKLYLYDDPDGQCRWRIERNGSTVFERQVGCVNLLEAYTYEF